MDYTGLLLTLLLALLAVSSQESHPKISRGALTRTKARRTPDTHGRGTDTRFSAKHEDVIRDRKFEKRFYGPGYYVFPDSDGCGGNIEVEPGYQYGQLVSPNWPLPYPTPVHCHWDLYGFDHIVIHITDLNIRGQRPQCDVDQLTLYFPKVFQNDTSYPSTKTLCGSDLAAQDKMIVAVDLDPLVATTVTFTVKASAQPETAGFVLTWMKFRRQGFATELFLFPVKVPDGNARIAYFIHVGTKYDTMEGHAAITMDVSSEGAIPQACGGYKAYLVDFGHATRNDLSSDCIRKVHAPVGLTQVVAEFQFEGQTKVRAPCVIEMTIHDSAKISRVNITYHRHRAVLLPCMMMEGAGRRNDINGLILSSPMEHYLNCTICGAMYGVPVTNPWDSFIQVRTRIDVEESPSCLFDYLLVGGRRVCGKGVQQLVSPSDNAILERAGGRYLNILEEDLPVRASRVAHKAFNIRAPLNSNPSLCYWSHPGIGKAYWSVELVNEFLIHGVEITTMKPLNKGEERESISITMNNGGETLSLKCFNGFITTGRTSPIMCSSPRYARFVRIRKKAGNLTLCHIKVFINTAEPNLAAMNVARGKPAILTTGSPLKAEGKRWTVPVTDGLRSTCMQSPKSMASPFVSVDLGRVYKVFAVRVVTSFTVVERPMVPRKFKVAVYPKSHQYADARTCRFLDELTNDNTLINCRRTLRGRYVDLEETIAQMYICEMLVYALHDVLTRDNVALHKTGQTYLNKTIDYHPLYVDGDLHTCSKVAVYLHVDLVTLHVVTGVILSIGKRVDFPFHIRITDQLSTESGTWLDCETKRKLYTVDEFHTLRVACTVPRVGRYVALSVEGNTRNDPANFTTVCEIQVLGVPHEANELHPLAASLVNVALYKHAAFWPYSSDPSRTEHLDSGDVVFRTARTAVDGSRETAVTHCGGKPYVRWTVDLANIFTVHLIRMTRCNMYDEKSVRYTVQLHMQDPAEINTLAGLKARAHTRCGNMLYENKHYRNLGRSRCPEKTRGRYAVLIKRNSTCMCVREVEVLATPLVSARRFGVNPTPGSTDTWRYNLNFTSDSSVSGGGLDIFYGVSDLTKFKSFVNCGELVRKDNDTIRGPNYPNTYADDDDNYVCQWMIHTTFNGFSVVWVTFMNLARHPDYPHLCFGDTLLFSNKAGQQVVLCATVINRAYTLQSFENEFLFITLMVRIPENSSHPMDRSKASGFNIRVQSYPTCYRLRVALGIAGKPRMGVISSPLYPDATPPNALCHWTFDVYYNGSVELHFRDFNVEGGNKSCSQTALSIKTKTLTHTYCNEIPPDTGHVVGVTEGDTVVVVFMSDHESHGRGFQLAYRFFKLGDEHVFGVLHYRREAVALGDRTATRSVSTGQQYTTRLPATWTFSSLANAGRFVLTVPFIPDSERNGSCSKYLSIQTEYVRTGRKVNCSNTCQESYDVSPFTIWTIDLKAADLPRDRNYNFTFSFQSVATGHPSVG